LGPILAAGVQPKESAQAPIKEMIDRLLAPLRDSDPRVSLVVINHNYAEYVREAILSVKDQDYPNFECFVVDNASDDGSAAIIRKTIKGDSRFHGLFFEENLNQMGALLAILPQLSGQLVAVVDSDDFLFRQYVSSHVHLHATLERVGLTSNCVLEVDETGAVLSGRFGVFGLRSGVAGDRFHRVSREQPKWIWSPGTANMYRRDLLRLLAPLVEHRLAAADNYYVPFVNAVAGSALIDVPLSAYRLHGRNRHGAMVSLDDLRSVSPSGAARSVIRRRDIMETLCGKVEIFGPILGERFWDVMDVPAKLDGDDLAACYESEQVQHMLSKYCGGLRDFFGDRIVRTQLEKRMSRRKAELLLSAR
jgi:glycosyltransferase involved in cell wall biosynthesis